MTFLGPFPGIGLAYSSIGSIQMGPGHRYLVHNSGLYPWLSKPFSSQLMSRTRSYQTDKQMKTPIHTVYSFTKVYSN